MPYLVRKVRNKNLFKVINKETGQVHSKGTSLAKAEAQVRLLRAIDNNPKFAKKIRKGGQLVAKAKSPKPLKVDKIMKIKNKKISEKLLDSIVEEKIKGDRYIDILVDNANKYTLTFLKKMIDNKASKEYYKKHTPKELLELIKKNSKM